GARPGPAGPCQRVVGAGAADEVLDVAEGPADVARGAGLQVDGDGTGQERIVERVGPAAAVDVSRNAAAGLERERIQAAAPREVLERRERFAHDSSRVAPAQRP